jgi:plasmid stabilization system protein ParE
MKTYKLSYSTKARDDLNRLYDFLLDIDTDLAAHAIDTIDSAITAMRCHPYICRKAANGALGRYWRELIIDFGSSGYLVLFEIASENSLTIMAVKHQRESDYH